MLGNDVHAPYIYITAQKRETQVARDALSEAQIEMESIHSEKKQIMAQWQSSLVVLGRCDEALQVGSLFPSI